jgi:hypothetical protein
LCSEHLDHPTGCIEIALKLLHLYQQMLHPWPAILLGCKVEVRLDPSAWPGRRGDTQAPLVNTPNVDG